MIIDTVKKTIEKYKLFSDGDSVLVGLSGGADSVCLTHVLYTLSKTMNIKLYTSHINHGIRDYEALRDENFVRDFSNRLGIECFTLSADVPKISREQGLSEETVGRDIRYDFFEKTCKTHNIKCVATAHNKNDNAETLIMNFMRGGATNGLCGIPYKRGNIIRPILDLTRDEIEEYCTENGLEYMTDSTNLTEEYTRNKIRHTLIPYIQKEFNSGFVKTVTDNAHLVKEDNVYLDGIAMDFYKKYVANGTVNLNDFNNVDIAIKRRILRLMLSKIYGGFNNISAVYIADILAIADKTSGSSVNLPKGIVAKNEYGKIVLTNNTSIVPEFSLEVTVPCENVKLTEINKTISVSFADDRKKDGAIYISCANVGKIVIRNRRNGDKFQPIGMVGTKKVKEYFIDKKIPRNMRDTVPIIEINGEIAAVGDRVDRRFAFADKGIKIIFNSQEE